MKDTDPTIVLFRRWPKKEGGTVLALFPYQPGSTADGSTCGSYERVGQHASADLYGCIRATTPARETDADVQALKRELESPPYEYRLLVRRRAPTRNQRREAMIQRIIRRS